MSYNATSSDNTSQILGQNIIGVGIDDDIQTAIDNLSDLGGGIINLAPGQYDLAADLTIPSSITINGNGAVLDFGGGAFKVDIEGTDAYNTGTITIAYGDTTVVGSGTTFAAEMVGQSILLGDYWYPITSFSDVTHIELAYPFIGTDLAGDTFVIATTVDNVVINNLTVANASGSLLVGRYLNNLTLNNIIVSTGDIGLDLQDCGSVTAQSVFADTCTTWGMKFNNCPFLTLNLFSVISGGGISMTRVSNTGIGIGSFQDLTTVGLSFTNCYNIGMNNYSMIEGASHAIEFVSGNSDINISDGYINTFGGDGIKLTATSDSIQIGASNTIRNTTGYQIDIANANCDKALILGNILDGSGSGAVNDSGTGTLIRSNQGVSDS